MREINRNELNQISGGYIGSNYYDLLRSPDSLLILLASTAAVMGVMIIVYAAYQFYSLPT